MSRIVSQTAGKIAAVLVAAAWGLCCPAGAAEAKAPPLGEAELRALGRSDPAAAAEALWRQGNAQKLPPTLLPLAAELLGSEDPFAAALAEWAIADHVAAGNRGQQAVWPAADAPAWYKVWAAVPAQQFAEMDYVRQAVSAGIHRSGRNLAASCEKVAAAARRAAAETPNGGESGALAALEDARRRLVQHVAEHADDLPAHRRLWLAVRRAARPIVLARPAVDFRGLVSVKLHNAHSLRNITGSQYPWAHKPGGDICVQDGLEPHSPVREVLAGRLGPGHVHGIDLGWDADRVVFGYAVQSDWPPKWDTAGGNCSFELRTSQPPTHIHEAALDGPSLRQVTDHRIWSDFEPTYCANGDIAFASDRSGRSSECGKFSADHTVINLYACRPDGTGLRRLQDNKDIDRYPHSLDDGTIGYTRWDYQERHFLYVHSIWSVRPDGTAADAVFKQHFDAPYSLRDVRPVPGGPRLVAIGAGHHTLAYGPVIVVDPRGGINEPAGMQVVTPGVVPQEGPAGGRTVGQGGVADAGGLYQTPWALSPTCFVASYTYAGRTGAEGTFAVYLIDVYGNKELIQRDRIYSCTFPMPLRRRPRPPVLPDTIDPAIDHAVCQIADVHDGWPEAPYGKVKYIRIAQRVGWPLDEKVGAMRWIPGNAWEKQFGFWSWAPVRVIGTARVEPDGSAHFKVPADVAVYFQALDANQMELRRMRSHVTFQRGESRGCRGCHETQSAAPHVRAGVPLALRRQAETPQPPPWGSGRLLGYEWLIQPILDRQCVRCHGADKPAGGLDFTAERQPSGFLRSFHTMFPPSGKGKSGPRTLVAVSDRFSRGNISRTLEFGSHRSRLVTVLTDDKLHRAEVKLTAEQWLALVTWVDTNAPYHDAFFNKRPPGGAAPRRDVRLDLPDPFAPPRP